MRVGPYERIGPDLHTTWGTWTSPQIIGPPSELRRPMQINQIRGRHQFRTQPRPLGPGNLLPSDPARFTTGIQRHLPDTSVPTYAQSVGYFGSAVIYPPAQEQAADHQEPTKVGLYIFLGLLGAAVLLVRR